MTAWINAFLGRLEARDVHVHEQTAPGLTPARLLTVQADDWGALAHEAKNWECRWVAAWGEDAGEDILVSATFEKEGTYIVARTSVRRVSPILPSHTPYYPGADRPERHIQDLLGVAFSDHPDARRWTRHQAWKDSSTHCAKTSRRRDGAASRRRRTIPTNFSTPRARGCTKFPSARYTRASSSRGISVFRPWARPCSISRSTWVMRTRASRKSPRDVTSKGWRASPDACRATPP